MAFRRGLLTGFAAAVLLTLLAAAVPAHADVDIPSSANSKPATGIAAVLQSAQKNSAEPLPPTRLPLHRLAGRTGLDPPDLGDHRRVLPL